MAERTRVEARMESELKKRAEAVFAPLGLTASGAINLFYAQVALRGCLPFDACRPCALTEQTMRDTDAERDLVSWACVDDLFNKLEI